MKQKFLFSVEVFPMVTCKSLCVEQLVPDYEHGFQEEVVITSSDFSEASAILKSHFEKYINRYCARSMVSEVIK